MIISTCSNVVTKKHLPPAPLAALCSQLPVSLHVPGAEAANWLPLTWDDSFSNSVVVEKR